jgi:predicted amidohydrolase
MLHFLLKKFYNCVILYLESRCIILKITVVQPPYFMGDKPDEKIAEFLMAELGKVEKDSLIVLPEYSNAGGISDAESELAAIPRAKEMLQKASLIAKEKGAYIAINVLENRDGSIKNSTYLFDKQGKVAFIYDKIHLPPSEVALGIEHGNGACICELDGIRFGFMTCYDVYFNEQLEYLASQKPDIILIPGYQRGEATDIIRAQTKLIAFRCNAFVAKSSYSMGSDQKGGCSMILSPDGKILKDMGKKVGSISAEIDPHYKYMRTAGFGGGMIRNDDFINYGLRSEVFKKLNEN